MKTIIFLDVSENDIKRQLKRYFLTVKINPYCSKTIWVCKNHNGVKYFNNNEALRFIAEKHGLK